MKNTKCLGAYRYKYFIVVLKGFYTLSFNRFLFHNYGMPKRAYLGLIDWWGLIICGYVVNRLKMAYLNGYYVKGLIQ